MFDFEVCVNCPYCNYENGPSDAFCDCPAEIWSTEELPCNGNDPKYDPENLV